MILTADEVSRLYDIQGVLGTSRHKLLCPFPDHHHENYTPSFSIFWSDGKQRFRCHGCGRTGDVIDLIGYLNIPGYDHENPEHIKTAINILTDGRYSIQPAVPPPPEPAGIYQGEWKNYYPPQKEVIEYMEKRGISDIGKDHWLGQLDEPNAIYLTIPTFHNDVLMGIKLRLVSGHGARYKSIKGSKGGLFNYDGIKHVTGTVFIVKGEIAAMVMESYGYYACAPTNGESGDITPFISVFGNSSRRVVIGDNDSPPRPQIIKSTQRRAKLLSADLIYPPEQYKDIDEWLMNKPDEAQHYLNQFLEK